VGCAVARQLIERERGVISVRADLLKTDGKEPRHGDARVGPMPVIGLIYLRSYFKQPNVASWSQPSDVERAAAVTV